MRSLAVLAVPLLLLSAVCAQSPPSFPNLVTNPGFEAAGSGSLPASWTAPGAVYSRVAQPVHDGSGALQFVNADKGNYVMCSQPLPLVPGKSYEFSVWVKAEGIAGDDSGATICLEWYGADEKYLGGSYPAGVKANTNWTQLKGVTGRVPANATRCSVTCYVRKGMTGKAWWDNVEVRQWREPALQTMLIRPNYRGQITPETRRLELVAELALQDYDLQPADVALTLSLLRGTQTVREQTVSPTTARPRAALPAGGLQPGKYELQVRLVRKADGAVIGKDAWRLVVPTAAELARRTSYLDEHNRLIVGGKPFLPLGMYWSGISEEQMRIYADSAFNCLMPYGMPTKEQMDLAARYGQKVIYSVKDVYAGTTWAPKSLKSQDDERPFIEGKVKEFGSHPSLLAWYLNDELSVDHMPRLEAHQQWLEELDPNHPTWIVLYQVGQLHQYRKTYDVLGTDPYPIPMSPARRAADYTVRAEQSMYGSRALWQVPQAMNWASYRKTEEEKKELRSPTLPELRSMSWQCLTEGANGLIYYSWFDLRKDTATFDREWGHCKQVAAEIKQWSPVLLSVERAPHLRVRSEAWLHWTVRQVGGDTYLFAVNDEEQEHEAQFTLPRAAKEVLLDGQEKPVTPEGTSLPVRLGAFELKIYKLVF